MTLPDSALAPRPARGLFWNPYLQILITILFNAASLILLKLGADAGSAAGDDSWASWLGLQALGSPWTWLGILSLLSSFWSWLYALRFIPLGIAFALSNGIHVVVPIASWLFLGERIGWLRALGIAVILGGILLLAQTVAEAEEKT